MQVGVGRFPECVKITNFAVKTRNSALKTRNSLLNMMDFVSKMMDFAGKSACPPSECLSLSRSQCDFAFTMRIMYLQ